MALAPPFLFGLLFVICFPVTSSSVESTILLRFKTGLATSESLSDWVPQTFPCTRDVPNWTGILCFKGHVSGLQLEGLGLTGQVDVATLSSLPYLRTLDLSNNGLRGPLPQLSRLSVLKSISLSNNSFSGPIPDSVFSGMAYLEHVSLDHNNLTGPIPGSLASLPKLIHLTLDSNWLDGGIPRFAQQGLRYVGMANNHLEGPIPLSLSNMPLSSFAGNDGLCGNPMPSCSALFPGMRQDDLVLEIPKKKISGNKLAIVLLSTALVLTSLVLMLLCCFFCCYAKKLNSEIEYTKSMDSQTDATKVMGFEYSMNVPRISKQKLAFVREDREMFDMHDLLMASAEVLGSGDFGASYKVFVLGSRPLVVKRFKLMNNMRKCEFEEHMRRIGGLRHPNLIPLVAYHYRRDEKLFVSDFVNNGSLASHLHGNHSEEQPGLDWPTRLKVIKGVVNGLAYLYSEFPSLTVPHGHLKSSNVLLNDSFEPLLTDYALVPLIRQGGAQKLMVAFKSPEYTKVGRILKSTDVWCLGILILEVLTGKFPACHLTRGSGCNSDLMCWVKCIVEREEGCGFDKDMGGRQNGEGEMRKLLRIGLGCCQEEVDRRLELREVVEMVQELKE